MVRTGAVCCSCRTPPVCTSDKFFCNIIIMRIIAVDFDGTCVTHEYPRIGRDIGAQEVLRDLVSAGDLLILWTMRSGTPLADAVTWFAEHEIPLYGINENPTQKSWSQSPKAYAHVYVDDAAAGTPLLEGEPGERPFVNWGEMRKLLFPPPR